MAAEIMGLIYGKYGGSSKDLRPGGLNVQPNYMPHGGMSVKKKGGFVFPHWMPSKKWKTLQLTKWNGDGGAKTETHRAFMEATTKELRPERVGEGSLGKL